MTDWPEVPENVIEGVRERWPERAEPWLASLGKTLADLCSEYNGQPRDTLHARYGFVVSVDTPVGGLVIRSSPDPDGPIQAKVSEALAALEVAPAILRTFTTDLGTWTVMDEIKPGIPFALTDRMAADLDALAAPLIRLRQQRAPAPEMPSLVTWLRSRLQDDHLTDMPIWQQPATEAERQAALARLAELERDFEPRLCHGDASTWNLLLSGVNTWVLIDPRGLAGELAYDLAVLALKVRGQHTSDDVGRYFASIAEVSEERVAAWMNIAVAARV